MARRDRLSHSVLLKRKRGEPNGCTHDQEGIEEGGTGHTQDTSPKGGQQTKGRDFGAQACVDDRAVTACRHLEASGRAGDPANAPLSAARWLMNRTRDAQGLWCRAEKRG